MGVYYYEAIFFFFKAGYLYSLTWKAVNNTLLNGGKKQVLEYELVLNKNSGTFNSKRFNIQSTQEQNLGQDHSGAKNWRFGNFFKELEKTCFPGHFGHPKVNQYWCSTTVMQKAAY